MTRPLLRLEFSRAFTNRLFLICLTLGIGIAIVAAVESTTGYYADLEQVMPYIENSFMNQFAQSAFTLWMPNAVMKSVPNLFFFISPLFVGLAYAWSWRSDIKNGYAACLLMHTTRAQWYRAKALAVFAAGGAVVCIPLLVNLAIVLCFVPAHTPDIIDVVYTGLWRKVFLSEVLYTHPAFYVALRLILDFALAGLWGTTVLASSQFIRNRVAIVALPYIGLIVIKQVSDNLAVLTGIQPGALTILDQLKARGDQFYYGWEPVFASISAMFAISLAIPALAQRRDIL